MVAPDPGDEPPLVHPETTVAETLPRAYRRVLDVVDRLAALGARRDAARFRAAAIDVYSGAWDARSHRRLEEILQRAEVLAAEHERRDITRVA